MIWNWKQADWPSFSYDAAALHAQEAAFLRQGGIVIGAARHLAKTEADQLTVEIMAAEALQTSAIEGEILDRDSLQSSIRRQFGLATDARRVKPAEQGIAEMMVDLYRRFAAPLDHATMHHWHTLIVSGRRDLRDIGRYRTHPDPMQVVSGSVHDPKVHFEAPPSKRMAAEMKRFIAWFNRTAPGGATPMPALARAGIAHLYFVSIHPYEDGNGRIARALAEKCLAQGLGQPSLTALSVKIEQRRKSYYDGLERANKKTDATQWLIWFAETALAAQVNTREWIDFLIAKTRLFDRLRGTLNARQEKVLLRMLREGPGGFKGGLSAGNYATMTDAPPATVTRDLAELVDRGVLTRTGTRRGTRYWLVIGTDGSADGDV
jgi:Fic family protein